MIGNIFAVLVIAIWVLSLSTLIYGSIECNHGNDGACVPAVASGVCGLVVLSIPALFSYRHLTKKYKIDSEKFSDM